MKKKTEKKTLKSRYKTMPQPEIMHDFGELGKWSESTLRANVLDCIIGLHITSIENLFDRQRDVYKKTIHKLLEKCYIFTKARIIFLDFIKYQELLKVQKELWDSYRKYNQVMNRLNKQRKKEQ